MEGMYDNVSEWISDTGADGKKIIKGSSWKLDSDNTGETLQAPGFTDNAVGFRIVCPALGSSMGATY